MFPLKESGLSLIKKQHSISFPTFKWPAST